MKKQHTQRIAAGDMPLYSPYGHAGKGVQHSEGTSRELASESYDANNVIEE